MPKKVTYQTMADNFESQYLSLPWSELGKQIVKSDLGMEPDDFETQVMWKHLREVLESMAQEKIYSRLTDERTHFKEESQFAEEMCVNNSLVNRWLNDRHQIGLRHFLALLLYFREEIAPGKKHEILKLAARLTRQIRQCYLVTSTKAKVSELSELDFLAIHLYFLHARNPGCLTNANPVQTANIEATITAYLKDNYKGMEPSVRVGELVLRWARSYVLLRYAFDSNTHWIDFGDESPR